MTTLLPVDVADTDHALDAMDLAPGARQALQSDLARPPEAEAAVSPAPATAQPPQVRLAWIRLWDSEVEDGDVVRHLLVQRIVRAYESVKSQQQELPLSLGEAIEVGTQSRDSRTQPVHVVASKPQ